MTILDKIVAHKFQEVKERKALYPVKLLEKSIFFGQQPVSLKQSLMCEELSGIIAEFKRCSPSKGIINLSALSEKVCIDYFNAGASAVSVLTDTKFFGGSSDDLINVRKSIPLPVLRKDFIVDEYQIIEARSIGADAILLITSLHKAAKMEQLHRFAQSLGIEVLVEVHDGEDFSRIPGDTQMLGINSRNLASFSVDRESLFRLIHLIPGNMVKIAESGIRSVSDYTELKNAGFNGFLIGELFMGSPDPGETCKTFIRELGLKRNHSNLNL